MAKEKRRGVGRIGRSTKYNVRCDIKMDDVEFGNQTLPSAFKG